MSHACTPILVGVVSPVSELWLLFACLQKRPKFPFGPWTIVQLSLKNLIDRNQLKKNMQVGIDVTCMYTKKVVRYTSIKMHGSIVKLQ